MLKPVQPTVTIKNWNDCCSTAPDDFSLSEANDIRFITELTYRAESRFEIDSSAIYATGSSIGGQMAYRLAIERPQYFAAIAAFIGNLPEDSECENPSGHMPVFMMKGTQDPIIPFEGGATDRSTCLSAPATRDIPAVANNVDKEQRTETELPDNDPDDDSIIICEDDPDPENPDDVILRFCRIEGGGHVMPSIEHSVPRFVERRTDPPNRNIEGARFAWEILSRH